MKHSVNGARLLCVHTSEPYSEGASYVLGAMQTALVNRLGMGEEVIINTKNRDIVFSVNDDGRIEAPALNVVFPVNQTDIKCDCGRTIDPNDKGNIDGETCCAQCFAQASGTT